MEMTKLGIISKQCFPQGIVQSVDRTISFGGRVEHFALHAHLDHRFGKDAASLAVLDIDQKVDQLEGSFVAVFLPLQHHRYGSLRGFEGKAAGFQFLDVIEHRQNLLTIHFHTMFFGFAQQIPAPGQVGNNDPHLIANQFRLHMLV